MSKWILIAIFAGSFLIYPTFFASAEQKKKPGKIYTWRDKNGTFHSSNIPPPSGTELNNLKIEDEIVSDNRVTRIKIVHNHAFIPVTISYQGKQKTNYLLIDTGASSTLMSFKMLNGVDGKYLGDAYGLVADGRKVKTQARLLDYIKVGPFTEYKFKVFAIEQVGKAHHGLLGVDFLKKHPFTIDYNQSVIRWK